MSNQSRDAALKKYYLEGKSRQQAMDLVGITNSNSMSSASNRLKLHWSWPLKNRKSGETPQKAALAKPAPGGFMKNQEAPIVRRSSMTLVPGPTPALSAFENQPLPAEQKAQMVAAVVPVVKKLRPLQDSDFLVGGKHSPFPKPSADLPFETIAYIARHLYEKPHGQ
jgi:hypothetical protein